MCCLPVLIKKTGLDEILKTNVLYNSPSHIHFSFSELLPCKKDCKQTLSSIAKVDNLT